MAQIVLPSIADSLYNCGDPLQIIQNLRREISKISGSFLYRTPLDVKLEEFEGFIRYDSSHEQPFINKMKMTWAQDIRQLLITNNIEFDLLIRRKSVLSLLRKCNSVMAEKKAIDRIHDLIGVEIIIYTRGPRDKEIDIQNCYTAMNLFLNYLMTCDKNVHPGDRFLLCESTGVKGTVDPFISPDVKRSLIQVTEDSLFIPENSYLVVDYKNFVKDYIFQPKIKSFYQGLQSSICYLSDNGMRSYFEIQVKTQNMRTFLDTPTLSDGTPNPGYHNNFRTMQNKNVGIILGKSVTPQFDLCFDPEKCYHISGFRENPEHDMSGIIAPKKWSICNSTHS